MAENLVINGVTYPAVDTIEVPNESGASVQYSLGGGGVNIPKGYNLKTIKYFTMVCPSTTIAFALKGLKNTQQVNIIGRNINADIGGTPSANTAVMFSCMGTANSAGYGRGFATVTFMQTSSIPYFGHSTLSGFAGGANLAISDPNYVGAASYKCYAFVYERDYSGDVTVEPATQNDITTRDGYDTYFEYGW